MKVPVWLVWRLHDLIEKEYINKSILPTMQPNIYIDRATALLGSAQKKLSAAVASAASSMNMSVPYKKNIDLTNIKIAFAKKLNSALEAKRQELQQQNVEPSEQGKLDEILFKDLIALFTNEKDNIQKAREKNGNMEPGTYDSLLEVCIRVLLDLKQSQEQAEMSIQDLNIFSLYSGQNGDGSPPTIFRKLWFSIIKEYFNARIDFYKYYTPLSAWLTREYSCAESETLSDILGNILSKSQYMHEDICEQDYPMLYRGLKNIVFELQEEINKRIKSRHPDRLNAFIIEVDQIKEEITKNEQAFSEMEKVSKAGNQLSARVSQNGHVARSQQTASSASASHNRQAAGSQQTAASSSIQQPRLAMPQHIQQKPAFGLQANSDQDLASLPFGSSEDLEDILLTGELFPPARARLSSIGDDVNRGFLTPDMLAGMNYLATEQHGQMPRGLSAEEQQREQTNRALGEGLSRGAAGTSILSFSAAASAVPDSATSAMQESDSEAGQMNLASIEPVKTENAKKKDKKKEKKKGTVV